MSSPYFHPPKSASSLWRDQALALHLFSAAVLLIGGPARAQVVNAWTNPASAHWEDPYWSLGALPAADQTVAITNDGRKAVGIFPSTVANFQDSLKVTNLSIFAPSNAFSTLLLNYTGLNVPLRVLNDCTIGSNGSLVNLDGSLQIDGGTNSFDFHGLRIPGGNFVQEGGITVANRVIMDGTMSLTNATLRLGPFTVGGFIGLDLSQSSGTITQAGGVVGCAYLELLDASYTLAGGALYATNGLSGGTFNHLAGTNYADSLFVRRYTLNSGAIEGSTLAGADLMTQSGGVVDVTNYITISGSTPGGNSGRPNYALTNGVVRCPYLYVSGNGIFHQYGGVVSLTSTNGLVVHGYVEDVPHVGSFLRLGDYLMTGGTLSTPALTLLGPYSTFTQSGGDIQVSGGLPIYGQYTLTGGELATSYTGIADGASFSQTSGTHIINGVLSITGSYDLSGGSLSASGIWMHGRLSIASAAAISSPGLMDFGGDLAVAGRASLGQFKLSDNGTIEFAGSPATLGLQGSSDILWNSGSILTISNWNGLPTGGGANQLYFGSDARALTGVQLSQLRFHTPPGALPGYYPARLLPTGELVPVLGDPPAVLVWGATNSSTMSLLYPGVVRDVIGLATADANIAVLADGTIALWPALPWFSTNMPPLSNVVGAAVSGNQALALQSDGAVLGWGFPDPSGSQNVPPDITNAVAVAAGPYHRLALLNDGSIRAWGPPPWATSVLTNVPASAQPAIAIAATYSHSLSLRSDGTVGAWGYNDYGEINVPAGLSNVVAIGAGYGFSLALRSDGTVVAWGYNHYGQTSVPAGLSNVVAISAGADFCVALRSDGTVVAWGVDYDGQTDVPSWATNIVEIAAGYNYTLAVPAGGARLHSTMSLPSYDPATRSFSFHVTSRSGQVFQPEYKSSVLDDAWTPLQLFAAYPRDTLLIDSTPHSTQRFYRVRQW